MKAISAPFAVCDVGEERILPSYLELYYQGELARRIKRAYALLESCTLCPRECGVNRLAGQQGFCRAGPEPKVAKRLKRTAQVSLRVNPAVDPRTHDHIATGKAES
ncbi:MAG TPA: hypothetical protein EYP49_18690, partial [Anaerolineae bacterium]|nr:hypothetical protein [Anaerolineae bacterium]